MEEFIIGQRWISDTELHMGLGTVLGTEHRTVTVVFLATGETRVYAKQTAPLTRVRFSRGDVIRSHEGWELTVSTVTEHQGLLTYQGKRDSGESADLPEGQLDNFIQLSQPVDRLFSGQIDHNKWFELRYETRAQANRLAHSELYGLIGARTSLIPHQLYIAHEVARRYAPRVLLADEVGLGKTIEAGLIVHQQLLSERAQRVLIVVPETLLHQWLVEMLRRFNLRFSIFDEERCQSLEEENPAQSPFLAEQLVLCSLGFLSKHPQRVAQARAAHWDLLVVDEAHHLQWSPQQVSPEYALIETLAAETRGVLLLTATPEQLGKAGHFARLRLLDPDRFPDLQSFLAEESTYQPVAQAIDELITGEAISAQSVDTLRGALKESDNRHDLDTLNDPQADAEAKAAASQALITHLLDRHGTGRILFRNTRSAVKGFPPRRVTAYPLSLPAEYAQCMQAARAALAMDPQQVLSPESLYQAHAARDQSSWTDVDPRIVWLEKLLRQLKPAKVLVITAQAKTALALAESLRVRAGIHAPVFHEGMSIIERDRAAAFFADPAMGSQSLICSEIGSEGRNFQFAHHLVLFDLPLNPDLLEQRIGRLDRIGQMHTIELHVPYLENSPQATLFRWYHKGLGAFEHTCPAGHDVYVQVKNELVSALLEGDTSNNDLSSLINKTNALQHELNAKLHAGRDRLLEFNSCRPDIALRLKQQAEQEDAQYTPADYVNRLFDCFGVELEDHSEQCYILRPGEQMQAFPGLPEEGMTVTFDRATALVYEDSHFLSWEHPMLADAMDMILSQEQGNTSVTSIKHRQLPAGTLLLECIYVLATAAPPDLQIDRYLPPTSLRLVVDPAGNNWQQALPHTTISQHAEPVSDDIARKVVRHQETTLRRMLATAEQLAQQQAPEILESATRRGKGILFEEINRLKELRDINPNIRHEEIDYFEHQWSQLNQALASVTPRLDAIRIIVAM